jgi:hypothetical protein
MLWETFSARTVLNKIPRVEGMNVIICLDSVRTVAVFLASSYRFDSLVLALDAESEGLQFFFPVTWRYTCWILQYK